jgi:SET domain-containing protein
MQSSALPATLTLEVRTSRNGLGVFTMRACKAGQVLYVVVGKKVTCDIDDDMDEQARANTYRFDRDYYLSPQGTLGDYFNHSCRPNAKVEKRGQKLRLVAILNIPLGKEVCFDYSTITASDDVWQMRCRCGEKKCRKSICSFDTLPASLQRRYIRDQIVPKYILAINAAFSE